MDHCVSQSGKVTNSNFHPFVFFWFLIFGLSGWYLSVPALAFLSTVTFSLFYLPISIRFAGFIVLLNLEAWVLYLIATDLLTLSTVEFLLLKFLR